MGLGSALVDRARVQSKEPVTTARVAGSSVLGVVTGTWFDCRLELPAAPEAAGPDTGRRRVVLVPTLLYGDLDDSNDPIKLSADDRVEVDSPELGRTTWVVVGEPQPIRKRSEVMGFQATLRRIERREFEPLS